MHPRSVMPGGTGDLADLCLNRTAIGRGTLRLIALMYSVEQLPRCDLLRLIPSHGGFVLSERRDLGLCAGTARGSMTMANMRKVSLCVVLGLRPSQSRLKPPPSTDFFNHLQYC